MISDWSNVSDILTISIKDINENPFSISNHLLIKLVETIFVMFNN